MNNGEHATHSGERNRALAEAAATARTMLGYSIEGAAESMGVAETILRDAESGTAPINTQLRLLMERCYGTDLDVYLPKHPGFRPRTPLEYDEEAGVLRVGTLGVRFRKGVDSNDDLLRGFSAAIRRQRRLPPSVPLRLRSLDIPVLAELLDLTDPELDDRAQFWFGQTPETQQGFKQLLGIAKLAAEAPA